MFNKILIANRGEVAVRIINACREMGIKTVAVYSEADAGAKHTRMADQSVCIGPPAPGQSYLRGDKIISAALETGAQAIHPGYGFLAESAAFVEQVQQAGLTFIGPNPEAIRLMGNKTSARSLMQQAGVPVVPGYQGGGSQADFARAAAEIGYPLLVKASAGGGGKGMRVVQQASALSEALSAARREAQNAFGNDEVYLEKYIENPHHIEFQILADSHGATLHLFERECSIQRRHQKIIEETPSPLITPALREKMAQAAIKAAQAVNYINAGTIEFLADETGHFYFLEMNTRLQVEHPITEMITGIDLVQAQIRISAGEALNFKQADVLQRGHAIECRIYAEDPANNFLPAIGPILQALEPQGIGIRVDSGLNPQDEISVHYDPMIAKLIVYAQNRAGAIQKMLYALDEYAILGLTTNIPFLRAVLNSSQFRAGQTDTHFIEKYFAGWLPEPETPPLEALVAAALFEHLNGPQSSTLTGSGNGDSFNPWRQTDGFRTGGSA